MAVVATATPAVLPIRQFHVRPRTSISASVSQVSLYAGPRKFILLKSVLEGRVARKNYVDRNLFCVRANASNGRDASAVQKQENVYVPQSDFYKIEAIVRPWRLSHVASALIKMGIRGVTVYDVRGFGAQGGARERYAGSEFTEDSFVQKVKLEVVVSQDQVEAVIDTIIDHARTGEIGDGKMFISPVADVVRVRTGERGLKAERMAGGRAEILGIAEQ
ncbi:hypothetical protein R1sor_019515 [Riccia sorocarpa]|uniref:Nitrogen regulatory protein P-II homolog n=1 Tax=Riccia sorocarpa TaxID=122646 RepID=A0ABD3ICV3_9MARC